MEKGSKRLVAMLLAASLLVSSKAYARSEDYTLNNEVSTYSNASDAARRNMAKGRYLPGRYYVFKEYKGMLNITRYEGYAGAWINPNDNGTDNVEDKEEETSEGFYTLHNSVSTYSTAYNARKGINAVGQYKEGKYYIFKEYNGMLNISRYENSPGAWINPENNGISENTDNYSDSRSEEDDSDSTYIKEENNIDKDIDNENNESTYEDTVSASVVEVEDDTNTVEVEVKPQLSFTIGDQYILNNIVPAYTTARQAMDNDYTQKKYMPGNYYIYKVFGDSINISKSKNTAGAWINPIHNGNVTRVEEVMDLNKKESYTYEKEATRGMNYPVYDKLYAYSSSFDALYSLNPQSSFKAGNYYVYAEKDGMINISSYKDTEGKWINPRDNDISKWVKAKADPKKYLNRVAEDAKRLASENDLYASVMIAQSMLETGFGTSVLSQEDYNNLFGIKGEYNGQSVLYQTTEYVGGEKHTVLSKFKKYDNVSQSLQDYVDLLTGYNNPNNWRYKYYYGARKSTTDSYRDATAYLTGKYATSPNYNQSLNNIIERYDLTRFDTDN